MLLKEAGNVYNNISCILDAAECVLMVSLHVFVYDYISSDLVDTNPWPDLHTIIWPATLWVKEVYDS